MAVETNVGGPRNPCTHPVTARSARDARIWVCLYCGVNVPSTEQATLDHLYYEEGELTDLPEPPERRR